MSEARGEVIVARNIKELHAALPLIDHEEALVAVLDDAFDLNAFPVLDKRAEEYLSSGTLSLKNNHGRGTREHFSTAWLPFINISHKRNGIANAILPLEVARLAVKTKADDKTEVPGPLNFAIEEYRTRGADIGHLHTDGWRPNIGLNVHVTALGSGTLHIARLNEAGRALGTNRHFDLRDSEFKSFIDGGFHHVPLRAGTIAVFSAFGSRALDRAPTMHRVSSYERRASISIDQVGPAKAGNVPSEQLLQIVDRLGEGALETYASLIGLTKAA